MRRFFLLFHRVTLRHMRREKLKTLLTVLGIAVGVSVFTSIRISNHTAVASFQAAIDAVSGRAQLQIVTRDGVPFDETLFSRVAHLPGLSAATPVVESIAKFRDRQGRMESLMVLGIDVFTDSKIRTYRLHHAAAEQTPESFLRFLLEPDAVIVTAAFAERHGLDRDSTVTLFVNGVRRRFVIRELLDVEGPASALDGNVALLDIASAQESLGRIGKLDRIDLAADDPHLPELQAYLRETLPDNFDVREPRSRGEQVRTMLRSFQLNLTALTLIGVFVAMFLIYNTLTTSALRRRKELSVLRTIGAGKRDVFMLFVAEALCMGIAGSLIGIVFGLVLAQWLMGAISSSITALYILTIVRHIELDTWTLVFSLSIGIGSSVVAAVVPGLEAITVQPRDAFHRQVLESRFRFKSRRYLAVAAVALGVGMAILMSERRYDTGFSYAGFAAAFAMIVAMTFLVPTVVRSLMHIVDRPVSLLWRTEGRLAIGYLRASLRRTSIAVAALSLAVAMLISVNVMVESFRKTVSLWVDQSVNADLFLTVSGEFSTASMTPMPDEVIAFCRKHPGVKAVDTFRGIRILMNERLIDLAAGDLEVVHRLSRVSFIGQDADEVLPHLYDPVFFDRRPVAVSETFALRNGLGTGDRVRIPTPLGEMDFLIEGVYYDYTTDNGTLFLDRKLYSSIWRDSTVNNAALFLTDRSAAHQVRESLNKHFGDRYNLLIFSNSELREEIGRIFDQTFSVTYTLELIVLLVAGLGVAGALLASILEREREIGILKAVGAAGFQVRRMILLEGGLIGCFSEITGVSLGLALSFILIFVINRESFGWTLQLALPPEIFALSFVLVLCTAWIAAIVPAGFAARKLVRESVRFE